jgi:hypothetical protein
MIAQGGSTTQRVVPLSRLRESCDFLDSESRATKVGVLRLNERGLPLCFSKKETRRRQISYRTGLDLPRLIAIAGPPFPGTNRWSSTLEDIFDQQKPPLLANLVLFCHQRGLPPWFGSGPFRSHVTIGLTGHAEATNKDAKTTAAELMHAPLQVGAFR